MSEWKELLDKDGKPVTLESSKKEWKEAKNEVGGNLTLNPYTTFTIVDSKGIPHKISGTDEADAYRQAIASGITPRANTSKERSRIASEFGAPLVAKLAPENTRTILETGDWSLVDAAKDAFTLPQRALAGAFGGDMGKTSDEYASEGKTLKSIATSPLIVPNVLAGLSTGGLSLPVQIATTGAVGVGSGLAFDESYGGSDVALDVLLSATPALGPVLASLPINASLKSIKGALGRVGITGADADEIAQVIQRRGYDAAPDIAKNKKFKALLSSEDELIPPKASDFDLAEIEKDIATSAGGGDMLAKKTRGSLQEAAKDIARAKEGLDKLKLLEAQAEAGTLTQSGLVRNLAELTYEYRDIPEFTDALKDLSSRQLNDEMGRALDALGYADDAEKAMDQSRRVVPDAVKQAVNKHLPSVEITPTQDLRASRVFDEYSTARQLEGLTPPQTSSLTGLGLGDIFFGNMKKGAQKFLLQPSPAVSNAESGLIGLGVSTTPAVFQYMRD